MPQKKDYTELLLRYVAGELSADECREVEALAESDPAVKDALSLLQLLADDRSKGSGWEDIQAAAEEFAARLFDDFQLADAGKDERRGIVTYDSKYMPLPDGVRPASVSSRDIKYRIGDGSLDLSFYPVGLESYEVIGHVNEVEGEGPFTVTLESGKRTFTTDTDRFGLFRFERIPAAEYRLTLKVDDKSLGVMDVHV